MSIKEALEAHQWLSKFYHYILMHTKNGEKAKTYLEDRGINKETLKTFQIGFSPFDIEVTQSFLANKGFKVEQLVNDKVLRKDSNDNLSNLLNNRITFPILNDKKEIVAFGGRAINDNNKIKYLNSEDSEIFKKENNLFGIHQAKDETDNMGFIILLEGYFDVLNAHQNGVKNSIASLGTSLTKNQALFIKNITNNIVIAYDGDEAGMENSFRSASILDSMGCNVKIAHINNEQDPDEFITNHGGERFMKDIICKAEDVKMSLIDYKAQHYNLNESTERYDYAEEILKGVLKSNQHNEQVIKKIEDVMDISFSAMQEEILARLK